LEVATLLEKGELTPKSRKLFAYFGHDKTIYPFLVALGFETVPQLCAFGATLIMELHRNKTTSEIGYKVCVKNSSQVAISLFNIEKQFFIPFTGTF